MNRLNSSSDVECPTCYFHYPNYMIKAHIEDCSIQKAIPKGKGKLELTLVTKTTKKRRLSSSAASSSSSSSSSSSANPRTRSSRRLSCPILSRSSTCTLDDQFQIISRGLSGAENPSLMNEITRLDALARSIDYIDGYCVQDKCSSLGCPFNYNPSSSLASSFENLETKSPTSPNTRDDILNESRQTNLNEKDHPLHDPEIQSRIAISESQAPEHDLNQGRLHSDESLVRIDDSHDTTLAEQKARVPPLGTGAAEQDDPAARTTPRMSTGTTATTEPKASLPEQEQEKIVSHSDEISNTDERTYPALALEQAEPLGSSIPSSKTSWIQTDQVRYDAILPSFSTSAQSFTLAVSKPKASEPRESQDLSLLEIFSMMKCKEEAAASQKNEKPKSKHVISMCSSEDESEEEHELDQHSAPIPNTGAVSQPPQTECHSSTHNNTGSVDGLTSVETTATLNVPDEDDPESKPMMIMLDSENSSEDDDNDCVIQEPTNGQPDVRTQDIIHISSDEEEQESETTPVQTLSREGGMSEAKLKPKPNSGVRPQRKFVTSSLSELFTYFERPSSSSRGNHHHHHLHK